MEPGNSYVNDGRCSVPAPTAQAVAIVAAAGRPGIPPSPVAVNLDLTVRRVPASMASRAIDQRTDPRLAGGQGVVRQASVCERWVAREPGGHDLNYRDVNHPSKLLQCLFLCLLMFATLLVIATPSAATDTFVGTIDSCNKASDPCSGAPSQWSPRTNSDVYVNPVSYTHLTLPTIYSV